MNRDEELKLAGERERGGRAKALLDSDIFRDAFSAVENGIIDKWKASPIRDIEGQHELRLMLKALYDVKAFVLDAADTGKMAAITLESERKRAAAARRGERIDV